MKGPLYKQVPRSSIIAYARSVGFCINFEDFIQSGILKQGSPSFVADSSVDATSDLGTINLEKVFPLLKQHEYYINHKELVGLTKTIKSENWTRPKEITSIDQLVDLSDFQFIENFDPAEKLKPDIFTNKTSPKECELEDSEESMDTWLVDTISVGHSDETIVQHKEVIKSLIRMEQQAMGANYEGMKISEYREESLHLEPPLMPFTIPTNLNQVLDPFLDLLNSEPTLADNDLSDEMGSLTEEAQKYLLNDVDLNSILNNAHILEFNEEPNLQLELPEFCEPQSAFEKIMDDKMVLQNLVNKTQTTSWAASLTPEDEACVEFVNEDAWEEQISKTNLLRLPLPVVEKTCLQTKLLPKLPDLDFPEWKFSYTDVCSLNWTPFSMIQQIPVELITEFEQYKDLNDAIEKKYSTIERYKIFKPIEKCFNIPDLSLIDSQSIEVQQTKSQLDADLEEISSEDSDLEILGSKDNILEVSDLTKDISVFDGFTDVFDNSYLNEDQDFHESSGSNPKRKLGSIFDDGEDGEVWNEIEKVVNEGSNSNRDALSVSHLETRDSISNILNNLENEGNSDEEWTALKQVIAKQRNEMSVLPQTSHIPQPKDLLSFSPYFNQPQQPNKQEQAKSSKNSFKKQNTKVDSFSSPSKDSSILWYFNKANDDENLENNATVVWSPPSVVPNSLCSSSVIINTCITPISIVRLFHAKNCAVNTIEADLGGLEERDGSFSAANFYLSHKACIVLFPLINIGQRSMFGDLKAVTKLRNLKTTIDLVFAIIMIDQPGGGNSITGSLRNQLSKIDEDHLRIFQVTVSRLPWVQTFILPCNDKPASQQNLPNLVAHLTNIHGTDIPPNLFQNIPQRSLQFLRLCGINCVAAAMILKEFNLVELIQASPAYFAIRFGDLVSQDQLV